MLTFLRLLPIVGLGVGALSVRVALTHPVTSLDKYSGIISGAICIALSVAMMAEGWVVWVK